jgi:hypothetical protein
MEDKTMNKKLREAWITAIEKRIQMYKDGKDYGHMSSCPFCVDELGNGWRACKTCLFWKPSHELKAGVPCVNMLTYPGDFVNKPDENYGIKGRMAYLEVLKKFIIKHPKMELTKLQTTAWEIDHDMYHVRKDLLV